MLVTWENLKEVLKSQIPVGNFQLWIDPLKAEWGAGGELLLNCPNPFTLRWVQAHYLKTIRQALETAGQPQAAVHLKLLTAPSRPVSAPPPRQAELPLKTGRTLGKEINHSFTFDRFVVGASNRLAFQASRALARNDTVYNRILFLTSGPGLGKSHLTQAVGNYLHHSHAPGKVLYLTAEHFANEMVQALKGGRISQFKEQLRRQCDVLLLEEVHFLSGKEKIQAELCYTLDALMGQDKRLLFTSCYYPSEIGNLTQELRSRFTGGVITPISPPDFATRVQILVKKADARGWQIPVKILEYLAEYVTDDVRRLESALDGLAARSTLLNRPFSQRLAQEVLQDLQAVEGGLSAPQIQKLVCDYYGIRMSELVGRSRQKRLVRARQMALYFCRLYTDKTTTELGRLFQRSHAAVVHALQALERDRQTQSRVAQEVQLLEEKMAQLLVIRQGRSASTPRTGALSPALRQ